MNKILRELATYVVDKLVTFLVIKIDDGRDLLEAEIIRQDRREPNRYTYIIDEDLESSNKILRQDALKMQYNTYIRQPEINLADGLLHPNELISQWAERKMKAKGEE